jgi:hypothetical protein
MKLDKGTVLLYSAVAVGAPRWAGAFLAADVGVVSDAVSGWLNVFNVLSGIAMAPLEVLTIMYMLDALRRGKMVVKAKDKTRINWKWWGVLLFVIGLFVLTPCILAPFIMSRMNATGMAGILTTGTLQLLWSVFVVFAPIFMVGGVAFATRIATSTETGSQKSKTVYPRACSVENCDYVASNRYAYSAHMKLHKGK